MPTSQSAAIRKWKRAFEHELANSRRLSVPEDLYRGTPWAKAKIAASVLQAAGGSVHVMSPGVGLVGWNDPCPGYSATFSRKSVDLVPGGATLEGLQRWWAGIGGRASLLRVVQGRDSRSGPSTLLVAVPRSHLRVIAPVLVEAAQMRSCELVVVGGGDCPIELREVTDAWVRAPVWLTRSSEKILRGPAGSLTAGCAAYLTERFGARHFTPREADALLARVKSSDAAKFYLRRKPMSSDAIVAWLRRALADADGRTSKTDLLRRFRSEGFACERRRFGNLYDRVIGFA